MSVASPGTQPHFLCEVYFPFDGPTSILAGEQGRVGMWHPLGGVFIATCHNALAGIEECSVPLLAGRESFFSFTLRAQDVGVMALSDPS